MTVQRKDNEVDEKTEYNIISMLIMAYNKEKYVEECIDSCMETSEHIKRMGYDVEIVAIDDCSTDDTLKKMKKYDIRVLRTKENVGPSAVCYIGSRHIYPMSKFLIVLGADMILHAHGLCKCIKVLEKNEKIGAISGIHSNDGVKIKNDNTKIEFRDVIGGCVVYRVSALRNIGSFNPFIRWGEEWDVCYRMGLCGYQIAYLHEVIATHRDYSRGILEHMRRRVSNTYRYKRIISAYKHNRPLLMLHMRNLTGEVITSMVSISLILLLLLFFYFNDLKYIYFFIVLFSMHMIIVIYIKKSLKHGIRRWLGLYLTSPSALAAVIAGFLSTTSDTKEFEYEVEVIS